MVFLVWNILEMDDGRRLRIGDRLPDVGLLGEIDRSKGDPLDVGLCRQFEVDHDDLVFPAERVGDLASGTAERARDDDRIAHTVDWWARE